MDDPGNITSSPLTRALGHLRELLPSDWEVIPRTPQLPQQGQLRPDAEVEIWAPHRQGTRVLVQTKPRLDPVNVPDLVQHFAGWPAPYMVVAPFLSTRTQERLEQAGISFADSTGNIRLQINGPPALFVKHHGAQQNPFKRENSERTLKTERARRIALCLCDLRPPLKLRQLAGLANTNPGYVSRIVELLEREALVERSPQGHVLRTDWHRLIQRLTEDYAMLKSNEHRMFLEPRGLGTLEKKLEEQGRSLPYLLTGSIAAERWNPVAPVKQAALYVPDIEAAAERLGLREASIGGNVVLLRPRDPKRWIGLGWWLGNLRSAPLSLVALDLLTGPGRGPSEGEALLSWMARNETRWRALDSESLHS